MSKKQFDRKPGGINYWDPECIKGGEYAVAWMRTFGVPVIVSQTMFDMIDKGGGDTSGLSVAGSFA